MPAILGSIVQPAASKSAKVLPGKLNTTPSKEIFKGSARLSPRSAGAAALASLPEADDGAADEEDGAALLLATEATLEEEEATLEEDGAASEEDEEEAVPPQAASAKESENTERTASAFFIMITYLLVFRASFKGIFLCLIWRVKQTDNRFHKEIGRGTSSANLWHLTRLQRIET